MRQCLWESFFLLPWGCAWRSAWSLNAELVGLFSIGITSRGSALSMCVRYTVPVLLIARVEYFTFKADRKLCTLGNVTFCPDSISKSGNMIHPIFCSSFLFS